METLQIPTNKLFINANHPLFSTGYVFLDGVNVTERGVLWVDLGNQCLRFKKSNEETLKSGIVEGEIAWGKIEIAPSYNLEHFDRVCELFPELKSYIHPDFVQK